MGELGLNWDGRRGEKFPRSSSGALGDLRAFGGKPGGRAGRGDGEPLGPMGGPGDPPVILMPSGDPPPRICRGGDAAPRSRRGGPPGGGRRLGGRWRGVILISPWVGLGDLKNAMFLGGGLILGISPGFPDFI